MCRGLENDASIRQYRFINPMILAVSLSAFCSAAFGQGKTRPIQPRVFEIPKNGIFDSRQVTSAERTVRPSTNTTGRVRRAVSNRMKRRLRQMATRVDRTSANAFQRGLMDLDDLAVHQEAVFRMRLAARNDGNGSDRTTLLLAKIRRFDRAAQRLERFKQPASGGWAASVAQSRLLATNARIELALSRDDRSAIKILAERSVQLATQFYRLRKADYDIGRADDRKMAKAIAATVKNGKSQNYGQTFSQPSDRVRAAITQRITRDKASAQGTRKDELAAARFQLAESRALSALVSGKTGEAVAAVMHADRESQQQFQHLQRFSKTGTASLFDMTRAWLRRDDMQRAVVNGGGMVSSTMLDARRRDLKLLETTAAAVKDPRGRNAADVALVNSLQLLETARPLMSSNRPSSPTSETGQSTVKPRIVDFTKPAPSKTANGNN